MRKNNHKPQEMSRGGELSMIDHIDVHDLSPEEVKYVQQIVEELKAKSRSEDSDKDFAMISAGSFERDWENEKDALYDNWKERYHVPQG